jgi:uncharacterized metal-binding protein
MDTTEKRFVLACSGASDLGELSDKVARKLRSNGIYQMKCLAMLAAEHNEVAESLKNGETLVIDGCPVDCGRKIMEEAWLTNYQYLRLTDLGYIKGQTPVNEETVNKICDQIIAGMQTNTIQQEQFFSDSCCNKGSCK